MRLLTFRRQGGAPETGVLAGDSIIPLGPSGFSDMLAVIGGGPGALDKLNQAVSGSGERVPASSVTVMAPIARPPKIICVGLNYRDHAEESKMEIPKVPTIFNKFHTAVIGPSEPVILPKASAKPDYEAEMAVVIGSRVRNLPAERWQEAVFGYTIVNDVSARDFQMATTQWLMGKTFDTFCPLGPHIVTKDEIADPHTLNISMTINGEVLQSSNTKHLIFRVPDLIAYLSSVFTLEPGDIISTGTPAGVGFARTPPRWLRPGDEMVVHVDGIGDLRNPVTAEA